MMNKQVSICNEGLNSRHTEKMKKKKAVRDRIDAERTGKKGLLIVHTGNGKGKSTAAFGMVFRALAHGMHVGVVQFGKGSRVTGERIILERFGDQVTVFATGQGFTWETQDRAKDITTTHAAWSVAKAMILDESYDLVLCDELNITLCYGYLQLEEILETLSKRAFMKHVIITGRNARSDLIEMADLVTKMELVKHPFRSGIKGQIGIEF